MEYVFEYLFSVSMFYYLTLFQVYIVFKYVYRYSLALISSFGHYFPEKRRYFDLV